jgi:hypothetical protein
MTVMNDSDGDGDTKPRAEQRAETRDQRPEQNETEQTRPQTTDQVSKSFKSTDLSRLTFEESIEMQAIRIVAGWSLAVKRGDHGL